MNPQIIEAGFSRFKSMLLLRRPFFGDILLRLPILQDDSIPTAGTDGWTIRWNSRFMGSLSQNQRNYVLMHEVFHTLLMHPSRGQNRNPEAWNIAADLVVNHMCDRMVQDLAQVSSDRFMERPPYGIFSPIDDNATAESLYGILLADVRKEKNGTFTIQDNYRSYMRSRSKPQNVLLNSDLLSPRAGRPGEHSGGLPFPLTPEEEARLEKEITALLRNAAASDRSSFGSYYVPAALIALTRPEPVSWREVLKNHLSEAISDDSSYATPERKYLHMDLILPGYSLSEEGDLEEVWAFVDSSGSISQQDLNQFLTQLYRIVREFRCEMNLCYWDTQVTEVYRKIRHEKQLLECVPHHTGGTDINCIYRWMSEHHVRPYVMLILTDGYFGTVQPELRKHLRPRDTILVLCNQSENREYAGIGRICRLYGKRSR